MSRRELVDVALGKKPADLVIVGGRIVNVLTAEIHHADVAIKNQRIAYVGDVSHTIGTTTQVVEAAGFLITPGLIDTHQHSYETHLNMTEYAKLLLCHGTTTIAEAFYGVANVGGVEAIRFCLEEVNRTPLKTVFLLPVLSHTQNAMLGLPSTPKALTEAQLSEILDWEECRGLEDAPFSPIVRKEAFWLDLFDKVLAKDKIIMGYAPDITERELAAYLSMGVCSDNSATNQNEALTRLRMGCRLNAREGTMARNIRAVVRSLLDSRLDGRGVSFCGDTVDFLRIVRQGHVDYDIRLAVGEGIHPITAVQMATINAAEVLKIDDDRGLVAPGKTADVVLVKDLEDFRPALVIANGAVVAENGEFVAQLPKPTYPPFMRDTVRFERSLRSEDFRVIVPRNVREADIRVMHLGKDTNVTEEGRATLRCSNGEIPADPARDILKIAMIDRYSRGHLVGVAFIQGFGLRAGAIGTSFAPQTENVIVLGANDEDMAVVANDLATMGGGFTVANGGARLASLETPLYGLLYDGEVQSAVDKMRRVYDEIARLGCKLENPFFRLGFMGPNAELKALKITPYGLVNVATGSMVSTVISIR